MKENLQRAREYVNRSNQGDLEAVAELFAEDATYHSSHLGDYRGIAAIQEMMRGFFARFENPKWEVAEYHPLGEDGVVFDFTMSATDSHGVPVHRSGRETIRFDPDHGRIVEIRVEVAHAG